MKTFTTEELNQIYNKHCNLSYNYFKKYEKILNFILPGRYVDFPRRWTVLDFIEWTHKHNINLVDKLLITGIDQEMAYLKYNKVTMMDYNVDPIKYDLHIFDLPEKDYDFCLFSQTLEHLYNPQLAMERIYEHIKPGGYVFTSVPTNNIPHLTPIHFQHFTPMGLAILFISTGFEVLEIGQFGNKRYIEYIFEKLWYPTYEEIIDKDGLIPNDPAHVCQCWILAKKI
jgi:SAM-dependent methyltransferase